MKSINLILNKKLGSECKGSLKHAVTRDQHTRFRFQKKGVGTTPLIPKKGADAPLGVFSKIEVFEHIFIFSCILCDSTDPFLKIK